MTELNVYNVKIRMTYGDHSENGPFPAIVNGFLILYLLFVISVYDLRHTWNSQRMELPPVESTSNKMHKYLLKS